MKFYYEGDITYEPDEDELLKAVAVILAEDAIPYRLGERILNKDGSISATYINNRSKEELALIRDGAEIAIEKVLKDNDIDIDYKYDDLRDYFEDIAKRDAMDIDMGVY